MNLKWVQRLLRLESQTFQGLFWSIFSLSSPTIFYPITTYFGGHFGPLLPTLPWNRTSLIDVPFFKIPGIHILWRGQETSGLSFRNQHLGNNLFLFDFWNCPWLPWQKRTSCYWLLPYYRWGYHEDGLRNYVVGLFHRVDITECSSAQFPTWIFNFWSYGQLRAVQENSLINLKTL